MRVRSRYSTPESQTWPWPSGRRQRGWGVSSEWCSATPTPITAAQSSDPVRPYHDLTKLAPHGRLLLSRMLPMWDGGPVQITGTIEEGDEVAGFRVIELPGHAPGLIGLFREQDRLALVSDCFYTLDPQTGIKGAPRVPHPAFNISTPQAADSIRKLAALQPSAAWAGHAEPVTGEVVGQLQRAAAAAPISTG